MSIGLILLIALALLIIALEQRKRHVPENECHRAQREQGGAVSERVRMIGAPAS